MKYLCAYALAWLASEKEPTTKELEKIITSIGGDFDKTRAQGLCDKLKGQNLTEIIKEGLPKLQSLASAGSGSGPIASTTETAKPVEETKKEEEEEDDAMDGAMDLFGGDDW